MAVTTLPAVEAVDLPALDDDVPCLLRFDGELCGKPATWRLSMRCSACGAHLFEVMSGMCRLRLLAIGFPDRNGQSRTTCCRAPIEDVSWSRL